MTKQELQKMIYLSVKNVINKEIKPLIETTIRKEFYRILNAAESAKKPKIVEEDKMSLINMIEDDEEADPTRLEVNEKIFQGKTLFKEDNTRFADVLNQTANEVENKTGIYSNSKMQNSSMTNQVKVNLNQPNKNTIKGDTSDNGKSMNLRENFAAKLGYENVEKVGSVENIPGTETKKSKVLEKISKERPIKTEIELPTMSAGGEGGKPKPIDYSKVPATMVQNMMKNYSSLMKKVESKVSRP